MANYSDDNSTYARARQTRVHAYARTHESEKRGDTYSFFKIEVRRRTQCLMRPRTPCFTNRVERNESLIILASTSAIAHTKFTIVTRLAEIEKSISSPVTINVSRIKF